MFKIPIKKQNIYALIAAVIWGTAFVAQSIGAQSVAPLTFNAARSLVAAIMLLIINLFVSIYNKKKQIIVPKTDNKKLIIGGFLCGLFLTIATALQQTSLADTSAGKAGFMTALYIVIVPLLGIFVGKKVSASIWISVGIAVMGLYFLCVKDEFVIVKSDFLLLMCAFMFAIQILLIDKYVQQVDAIKLSCVEFISSTVLSGIGMFIFEEINIKAVLGALMPILYLGVFSSGVAYTLQMMAQKDSNPTIVSLLMSLESVFSVIAGAIILGDKMSYKEYIGCVLMLLAVVLSQIPVSNLRSTKHGVS